MSLTTQPMERPEMLKKSCLALALCALGATASHAAILSIDYAGTVTGGISVNGTISWDTASTGTIVGLNQTEFQPVSASLFISNVNYSGNISNAVLWVEETGAGQDSFTLSAGLSGIAAFPLASSLQINFFDQEGGIFNGFSSLPSSISAFDGAETKRIFISGGRSSDPNRVNLRGDLTISESVTANVPEPGSLLLVALAGLALHAARRRQPAA